jgi:hypothetical protein
MRHLSTLAFGVVLSCFFFATAEAQSPALPSSPAQNPYDNRIAAPPDGPTQRDLKLMVPDGSGGLKELPDIAPEHSTGSTLITPTDPPILPPNETDGPHL